jgi:hypothetical protein
MKQRKLSKRNVLRGALQGASGLALGTVLASAVPAEAPPAEAITPQLIEATRKEGKVVWYTAIDLSVAEKIAGAFKEKFGGIELRVERTATDPPKKPSLGERSVMADGTEYNIFLLKESGQPVEAILPRERLSSSGRTASSRRRRIPMQQNIKLMKEDAEGAEKQSEEIKARYQKLFHV